MCVRAFLLLRQEGLGVLAGARCLARWLKPKLGDAQMVGIWLPPSLGGALANIADVVVGRWLTPQFAQDHPDVRDGLRAMLVGADAEGYAACCGAIERMDLRSDLVRIVAPTLVISAREDPSLPPEHGERIASAVPGARYECLDGAAHLANVEQPAAVTRLILDHLEDT